MFTAKSGIKRARTCLSHRYYAKYHHTACISAYTAHIRGDTHLLLVDGDSEALEVVEASADLLGGELLGPGRVGPLSADVVLLPCLDTGQSAKELSENELNQIN